VADIKVKENVKPILKKYYHIPYALKTKVKQSIDEMVQQKELIPVSRSEWASPIVVVPKSDGDIRICIDFKKTLNQVIDVDRYPLPHLDDVFVTMAKGKIFSVIDLKKAYQQLNIGDESKKYFTINTPFGLFRYEVMTYGVSSAIFQKIMEQILAGIENCVIYLDDILLCASDLKEMDKLLHNVFTRLNEFNVKINEKKCRLVRSGL
jgi:hypothetical protein